MKSFLWILIYLIPVFAFAKTAGVPTPGPSPLIPVPIQPPDSNPSLIPTITGIITLARGWSSLGFFVAVGTALKYLVDISQLSFIGSPLLKLPTKYQLLVRSFIAALIAVLGFIAAGAPIVTAIVAGLGTGAGSGFIHELIADFAPGAQSSGQSPPSAS